MKIINKVLAVAWATSLAWAAGCGSDDDPQTTPDASVRRDMSARDTRRFVDIGGVTFDSSRSDVAGRTDLVTADGPSVDQLTPDAVIVDTMPVDGPPVPPRAKCATPEVLHLDPSGTTTKNDDTQLSVDEFPGLDCQDLFVPLDGPQLYYKVSLKANKAYRVNASFDGGWDGAVYAFLARTSCTEADLNSACQGYAADSELSGDEKIVIRPGADEDWIIVVDSWSIGDAGDFTLTIEERDPPEGDRCANPKQITLNVGLPTIISGDTTFAGDEFAGLDCGGSEGPWPGAQLYYAVDLLADRTYRVRLEPTGPIDQQVDLALYAFPAATTCQEANINAACGLASTPTKRLNSDYDSILPEALLIATGGTDEAWIIAVDSSVAGVEGPFDLKIEEYTEPGNGTCATAIAGSPGDTFRGVTMGVANEFTGIDCGGFGSDFDGPQAYYRVPLQANTSYKAEVTGDFDMALYALAAPTTCDQAAVQSGCTSPTPADPFNVYMSDDIKLGFIAEPVFVKPADAGDWIFVVDGIDAFGEFELQVRELRQQANSKCAPGADGPQQVILSASPVVVAGDTGYPELDNEFGYDVSCGSTSGPWPGPNLYYRLSTLTANTAYVITVRPRGWDPAAYAFPASTNCAGSDVDAACTSPTPADPENIYSSDAFGVREETLRIKPSSDGDWIVVVDSYHIFNPDGQGAFELEVSW